MTAINTCRPSLSLPLQARLLTLLPALLLWAGCSSDLTLPPYYYTESEPARPVKEVQLRAVPELEKIALEEAKDAGLTVKKSGAVKVELRQQNLFLYIKARDRDGALLYNLAAELHDNGQRARIIEYAMKRLKTGQKNPPPKSGKFSLTLREVDASGEPDWLPAAGQPAGQQTPAAPEKPAGSDPLAPGSGNDDFTEETLESDPAAKQKSSTKDTKGKAAPGGDGGYPPPPGG